MTEPEDYEALPPDYHHYPDHLERDFSPYFADLSDTECLNCGCGPGDSIATRPKWWGVDFSNGCIPSWENFGIADRCFVRDLRKPFVLRPRTFPYTISTDFLEHIQEADIPAVLASFARLSGKGRHVIHAAPCRVGPNMQTRDGKTLHPSGHLNAADWTQLFRDAEIDAAVVSMYPKWPDHLLASWR